MYQLEDSLWWYRGQRAIARRLLNRFLPARTQRSILDCGSGTGGSLAFLRGFGEVTSLEASSQAIALQARRGSSRLVQASATTMPFDDASFDLVTVFDVFYSLDDGEESQALSEVARVLKPGGQLLWREPALMLLYGPHDVATHGKRRYTASTLRDRLHRVGLRPLRLSYANSLLLPVAIARRMLAKLRPEGGSHRSDVRPLPEPLNGVLARLLSWEAPLVERFGLPVGLSALALAEKVR